MKIGISSRPDETLEEPEWPSRFDVSEWDYQAFLELTPRSRLKARKLLMRTGHQIILSSGPLFFPRSRLASESTPAPSNRRLPPSVTEHLEMISELAAELPSLALLLRIPSLLPDPESNLRLIREQLPHELELWLDPGRNPFSYDIPDTHWVADPLWHPRSFSKGKTVFKLHGWHDLRWIRYYGPQHLAKLATICKKSRTRTLIFGHSKRAEEGMTFRSHHLL